MDLNLIISVVLFIIIFVVEYFILLRSKVNILYFDKKSKRKNNKKKDKIITITELELMKLKHKFYVNSDNILSIIFMIALINSFIIAITVYMVMIIPLKTAYLLLISFVMLMGLIYSIYELYARYLEKKYGGKNEL